MNRIIATLLSGVVFSTLIATSAIAEQSPSIPNSTVDEMGRIDPEKVYIDKERVYIDKYGS
jgi:hypothetical protein